MDYYITIIFIVFLRLTNYICLFQQPIIDNDLVEGYKKQIADLINEQRIGPELRVQDFDNYICLLNGEVGSLLLLIVSNISNERKSSYFIFDNFTVDVPS